MNLTVSVIETASEVIVRLEGHAGFRAGDLLEEPLRRLAEAKRLWSSLT